LFFLLNRRGKQIGLGPICSVIMTQLRQQSFGQQGVAIFAALSLNLDQHPFAVDVFGL
jgi:hypothetical protein